jgi:hypothetical protein
MNRLLLVVVTASLMGAGCIVSNTCDTRTVAVGWSSFQLANGTVTSSCATAAVNNVSLYMDDTFVTTQPCSAGGVNVIGVSNDGGHVFTVEALDSSSGSIALRDEVTVGNSDCTDLVVDTQPSEGTFNLAYSFSPVNVCNSPSYIWFSIQDGISGDIIAVDDTHGDPQQYACGAVNGITFPLPSGSYTLQRTEEVVFPGPAISAKNCTPAPFTISGATTSDVGAVMLDSTTFCP